MGNDKLNRLVIFIFSFLLIIIVLIIANTPSATDYEVDIYGVYSWYFWILIITTLLIGIIVILASKSKKTLTSGFFIIVVTNVVLLGLQFFRGYFFYPGGDLFTHVGFTKDILESGHIPSYNFYPFQHILTVNISQIGDISLGISSRLLSIIFYLLFVISLYIFIKNYSIPKSKYCLVLGTLLIFGSQYTSPLPNILSFLFFPLIFFLIIKIKIGSSEIRSNILLFIIVLSVIFFHPITSLYLLAVLVFFKMTNYFSFMFFDRSYELPHLNKTILSSIGAWIFWHMGFSSIRRGVTRTIYSIFYGSTLNPRAKELTQTLGMFDIELLDIIKKFIFDYGIFSILFLMVVLYMAYLSSNKEKLKSFFKQGEVLFFTSLVFVFAGWSVINFFADFVTFSRVFKFVILFSFLLIGFIFSFFMSFRFDSYIKNKNKHLVVMSMLVIFVLIVSVFSVYPSPTSLSSNLQITEQENEGMRWFFNVQNEERPTWEEGIRQYRWADFIYGREGENRPTNIRRDPNVKDHFGYDELNRMGENYSGYFINTEIHMITYKTIFSDYEGYWRFNESSYEKLKNDDSVNKIYNNGFFTSYYIEEVDNP